jgi:hypothetical protein
MGYISYSISLVGLQNFAYRSMLLYLSLRETAKEIVELSEKDLNLFDYKVCYPLAFRNYVPLLIRGCLKFGTSS